MTVPRLRKFEIVAFVALAAIAGALWRTALHPRRPDYSRLSLAELQSRAEKQPDDAPIHYALGARLRDLDQPQAAYDAFARAAQVDADDEASWMATAALARQLYGDQGAFDLLHTYLQRHPDSGAAHLGLAELYQDNHSHERALQEASSATRLLPANAEAWRVRGVEALALRQYADAESALRTALHADPGDWRNVSLLADALMEVKRPAEALPLYRRAAAMAPSDGVVSTSLGRALLTEARTPAELREAEDVLARAVKLRPDLPVAHMLLGRARMRLGDWRAARRALESAERLAPNDGEIAFALSMADRRLGDIRAANAEAVRHRELQAYHHQKSTLEEAIFNGRGNTGAERLELARLCASHGDYAIAVQQYRLLMTRGHVPEGVGREMNAARAALAMEPAMVPAQLSTVSVTQPARMDTILRDADGLFAAGHTAAAERAYLSAAKLDPRSAAALEGLGVCLADRGDTAHAIPILRRSVDLDARRVKAQAALAAQYEQAGFPDAARRCMETAVKYAPDNSDYWWKLGAAYGEQDNTYAEAEQAYRRAVSLAPRNPYYLMDLADQLGKSRKDREAESFYRQALAVAPDDVAVKSRFGMFLVLSVPAPERQQEAERLLKQVLQHKPDDFYAMYALGRLYFITGRPREAIPLLSRVVAHSQTDDTAGVWYCMAQCYRMLRDEAHAVKAIQIADAIRDEFLDLQHSSELLRMHPHDARLQLKLARMNAQRGQNARAVRLYQDCLRNDPSNPTARAELADLEARLQASGHMPSMAAFNTLAAGAARLQEH